MTETRKEAIELLERVPEDKLSFVIQIMRGVNGLLGDTDTTTKRVVNLDQFVMPATERGQNADSYTVFTIVFFRGESLQWNHFVAFGCLIAAVFFVFLKN